MMKGKLGIYARQSREKETTGSIDDQIAQGIAKAKELGLRYEIYKDLGESAAYDTLNNRKDFVRLLEDIKNEVITAVFVYDESRLTRNQTTKLIIKSVFSDYSIKVYTKIEGVIDFNDSDNEFISDIRTIFASKFVKDTSKKIKGVLRNRAAEGKAHTGILKPYGYTNDDDKNLVIHDEEAKVIKEIFDLYLLGYGTGKIAEKLNGDGVESKGRKLLKNGIKVANRFTNKIRVIPNDELVWVGNTILSILKNPIYKGERNYRNEVFKAPSIVSEEVWNKAQVQMTKNKRQTGRVKYNYLLRGLCRCGRCGANFVGRTRESKKDHYYYCSSKIQKHKRCGIRSINIDYLDELVWGIVANSNTIVPFALKRVEELKSPESIKELYLQKNQLVDALNRSEKDKGKILSLFKKDLLSDDEVEKEIKKINDSTTKYNLDLSLIESKLIEYEDFKAVFDEVEEFQKHLRNIAETIDHSLKYRLIRLFVEDIVINYDDSEEIFTIDLKVKVGDFIEAHTFYLSKQKHVVNDHGLASGVFNSGLSDYSSDSAKYEDLDDMFIKKIYSSIKFHMDKKKQSCIDESPPSSMMPPMLPW